MTTSAPLNVTTEVVSPVSTRITVTIPTATIDAKFETALNKAAKTVKINGFRPGKVPVARVRSDFGPGIRQDVINDLIRDNLFNAIDQEKLRAVGMPNVETADVNETGLVFTATVETYPEITLAPLNALNIERESATVTDADVDTMILNLRKQRQTFTAKTTPAENDDQVTFDFEGSIDGELFDGGASKDFKLVLGSNRMIPGFEAGIVGMSAGEEKVIDVTFPEDYQAEHLAGKTAQFKINVSSVETPALPEIDAEFMTAFGVKAEEGIDKFKADVRRNMERELKALLENGNKASTFDAVLLANDIEVPSAMVAEEVERERTALLERFAQQFGGAQKFDKNMLPDSLFEEKATRTVKLGVLFSKALADSKLTVDQERVTAFIAEMAQSYEDSAEVIEYYTNDKQQRAQIEGIVLEAQVVDYILASANVTDVPTTYEVVKAKQAAAQQNAGM